MKFLTTFIFLTCFSSTILAEACTYKEALLAFENNNERRGVTLMRMAAIDGDVRAIKYLELDKTTRQMIASKTATISLNSNFN